MPWTLFTPGEKHDIHCTGGWVATGPVRKGADNFALNGIRPPERPARIKVY
jgi:hypothetical protein